MSVAGHCCFTASLFRSVFAPLKGRFVPTSVTLRYNGSRAERWTSKDNGTKELTFHNRGNDKSHLRTVCSRAAGS